MIMIKMMKTSTSSFNLFLNLKLNAKRSSNFINIGTQPKNYNIIIN